MGRATLANLKAAAQPMLKRGVRITGAVYENQWLFLRLANGKGEESYLSLQNVGGLVYLPGSDHYAKQRFA